MVGFRYIVNKLRFIAICVNASFAYSEHSTICLPCETLPSVYAKLPYEKASQIPLRKSWSIPQKIKFPTCRSVRKCQKIRKYMLGLENPSEIAKAITIMILAAILNYSFRWIVILWALSCICLSVAKVLHTESQMAHSQHALYPVTLW